MISLEEGRVGYPKADGAVLSGLTFEVDSGEWLVVIGPNGSGKSTLLKALSGVLPIEGTLTIDGLVDPTDRQRSQLVAYVPQTPALPIGLTVAEFILLGRSAKLKWYEGERGLDRDRVASVIDELSLGPMAGRPITELSGGEVQRAALARALVQDAAIMVLDEPTSALDLSHQIGVLELVDQLRLDHDITVISAMHDLNLASRFGSRLVLVNQGSQVALGSPDDVLTAELLSAQFNTPVSVTRSGDGGLVIVPERTPPKVSNVRKQDGSHR